MSIKDAQMTGRTAEIENISESNVETQPTDDTDGPGSSTRFDCVCQAVLWHAFD